MSYLNLRKIGGVLVFCQKRRRHRHLALICWREFNYWKGFGDRFLITTGSWFGSILVLEKFICQLQSFFRDLSLRFARTKLRRLVCISGQLAETTLLNVRISDHYFLLRFWTRFPMSRFLFLEWIFNLWFSENDIF